MHYNFKFTKKNLKFECYSYSVVLVNKRMSIHTYYLCIHDGEVYIRNRSFLTRCRFLVNTSASSVVRLISISPVVVILSCSVFIPRYNNDINDGST